MTTGATILAFNNGVIDYSSLAAWSAHRHEVAQDDDATIVVVAATRSS